MRLLMPSLLFFSLTSCQIPAGEFRKEDGKGPVRSGVSSGESATNLGLEPFQIDDSDGTKKFILTIHGPKGATITYCSHMVGPDPAKWPTHITAFEPPADDEPSPTPATQGTEL